MTVENILAAAAARGAQLGLAYSGAVSPAEAWALRQQLPGSVIVDVRSAAEWQFVGVVPDAVRIELRTYPGMVPNPGFVTQLQQQVDKSATVLFICRSGARSDEAARLAAEAGYSQVYNVLEGFEGDRDAAQHRGSVNGWKAAGLPWMQG
ncbi:rhodanese-like domain-containing protein [Vogesella urethralis]|jgi:rhodanese-related sulfurtransferase|uniref:rhodanese-like domain-containing protein n=1 Tax=Vogesella urethralis TaxID=2592656 RepID=UPI00118569DE|nr:rhodanese-like domain-containing protein [Vogesella urethralis]MEC5208658.1 rhodanese-related sulfurtransferase [Vogesella perlucida]